MAGVLCGSPEGEKLKENLIQNYSMVPQSLLCPAEIADIAERGPSQMAGVHVTQKSRKSQKEAITDGDIYEGRLKARNYKKI